MVGVVRKSIIRHLLCTGVETRVSANLAFDTVPVLSARKGVVTGELERDNGNEKVRGGRHTSHNFVGKSPEHPPALPLPMGLVLSWPVFGCHTHMFINTVHTPDNRPTALRKVRGVILEPSRSRYKMNRDRRLVCLFKQQRIGLFTDAI
jgi:hypothetical protein